MKTEPEHYAFPVTEEYKLFCLVIIFSAQLLSIVQGRQEAGYADHANILSFYKTHWRVLAGINYKV